MGLRLKLLLFGILCSSLVNGLSETSKKRIICFHTHDVNERGVDVATFDYADFTETILGHISKILIPESPESHKGAGLAKYIERFGNNTIFYQADPQQIGDETRLLPGKSLPMEAHKHGCEFMYVQKGGELHSYPKYPDSFNHT